MLSYFPAFAMQGNQPSEKSQVQGYQYLSNLLIPTDLHIVRPWIRVQTQPHATDHVLGIISGDGDEVFVGATVEDRKVGVGEISKQIPGKSFN